MEEKDDDYNHDKNVDMNRCSDVVKWTGLLVLLLKALIMREMADKFQSQLIPQHRELVSFCRLQHTVWLLGSVWLHSTPVLVVCPRVLLSPISWGFHHNGSSTSNGLPGPFQGLLSCHKIWSKRLYSLVLPKCECSYVLHGLPFRSKRLFNLLFNFYFTGTHS